MLCFFLLIRTDGRSKPTCEMRCLIRAFMYLRLFGVFGCVTCQHLCCFDRGLPLQLQTPGCVQEGLSASTSTPIDSLASSVAWFTLSRIFGTTRLVRQFPTVHVRSLLSGGYLPGVVASREGMFPDCGRRLPALFPLSHKRRVVARWCLRKREES